MVNSAGTGTRLAREAEEELRKSGGELAGVSISASPSLMRPRGATQPSAHAPLRRRRTTSSASGAARKVESVGLSLKKPSRERSEKRTKEAAEKLGEGEKRIVADVPEHIHRQVRVRCLQRGVLVRDYIIELLAQDGIK